MPLSEHAARQKDLDVKMPQFQHRHYTYIAHILRELEPTAFTAYLALHFADKLARTNPSFNRTRFIEAAFVGNAEEVRAAS